MPSVDAKYQFMVEEWQNIDRHIQLFDWLYSLPLSVCYQFKWLFHKLLIHLTCRLWKDWIVFRSYADP